MLSPCSKRRTLDVMPRAGALSRPVDVRFDPETVARITALATAEGWTWRPSASAAPLPSVSEGVRRLVCEALDARDAPAAPEPSEHVVTVHPRGLEWIDAEAEREGVTRDDMVRTLLREARAARVSR